MVEHAQAELRRACAQWELPARSELLSVGDNGCTFALTYRPYVMRVTLERDGSGERALMAHKLSQWLCENEFPALPPVEDAYASEKSCVTTSRHLRDAVNPAAGFRQGELLAAFHGLAINFPEAGSLPELDIASRVAEDMGNSHRTHRSRVGGARDVLARLIDEGLPPSALGETVLHGGVSPKTFMRAGDTDMLYGFHRICRGPCEWDLATMWVACRYSERDGWDAFSAGYAHDLSTQRHFTPWASLAMLTAIAPLVVHGPDHPDYPRAKAGLQWFNEMARRAQSL